LPIEGVVRPEFGWIHIGSIIRRVRGRITATSARPTFAAAWFLSSHSVFAIQRRSRLRAVGFGKSTMRSRSISSFATSASRHPIHGSSSSSTGIHAALRPFVPRVGAFAFGPFTAREIVRPARRSTSSCTWTARDSRCVEARSSSGWRSCA
jgi:hypothetical protein